MTTPTRKRTAEREQFLKDVLITAIEGGISYWGAVEDYDPDAGTVTVYEEEYIGTDDEKAYKVTIDTIATGWGKYDGQTINGREYGKEALRANRTNGEEGDYDADVADNVLQLGIFGEIVYG